MENEFEIYYEDSPTQRVNYQVVNQLNKSRTFTSNVIIDKTRVNRWYKSFVKNKTYIAMVVKWMV